MAHLRCRTRERDREAKEDAYRVATPPPRSDTSATYGAGDVLSLVDSEYGGASGAFFLSLGSRPVAPVTLSIAVSANSTASATASPSTIVVAPTDWASPVEVTLFVPDDFDVTGDRVAIATVEAASDDRAYDGLAGAAAVHVAPPSKDTSTRATPRPSPAYAKPRSSRVAGSYAVAAEQTGQWRSGDPSGNV